ncbi:MAG: flagellar type III secretion system pore protein FliP [Alphaproteobacteria bacterium]|nr:flagellar type III secretion system pore protein FliP [Alphaproteobacteria bacterium]
MMRLALIALCALALFVEPAAAQQMTLDLGKGGGMTERFIQIIALITILSVAPSILMMVTSFVRIVVVLSLLRTAIGIQQSPPNSVIISLALFLTAFIMAPTFERAYNDGIQPLMAEKMEPAEAFTKTMAPVAGFMLKHVRESDLKLFFNLAKQVPPATAQETPLRILIPAFLISELRRAFEIGFLLFIPFLVIDLVVASLLMAMGMMMLPPVTISLPFKLIFFVLVDGWALVAGSLVQSYGTG